MILSRNFGRIEVYLHALFNGRWTFHGIKIIKDALVLRRNFTRGEFVHTSWRHCLHYVCISLPLVLANWQTYVDELKASNLTIKAVPNELVDRMWTTGRPAQPNTDINALPIEFAGI